MLEIQAIHKRFGKKEVVKGVTFSINNGESFGLLGPNGAGKSTTISMISGLLKIDDGDILLDGISVKKNPMAVKRKIGVVPQDIALYPTMSAKENLLFWGKMYGLTHAEAKQRVHEVLEFIGLTDRAKDKVETFSGGMKRRVNIGAALMHKPELLIMDEPTVGIDPQSRNHILETVKKLNSEGMTVIYTSHYMEEVEYLCTRIGIIDHGKVIALGTQADLCNRIAGGTVITLKYTNFNPQFVVNLKNLPLVERVSVNEELNIMEVFVTNQSEALSAIISQAVLADVQISSVDIKEPNLETLFLQLTGRSLRD